MARYGNYSYSSRRGRRRRGRGNNTATLKVFVVILPFVIIAVVAAGVFFAYKNNIKNNPDAQYPKSQAQEQLYTDEQLSLLISVVNEDNSLTADFIPELTEVDGVFVNTLASEELEKMRAAAERDGAAIALSGGYVSYGEQGELNRIERERLKTEFDYTAIRAEAEAKKTVPEAGCSERQTGLLLQFSNADGTKLSQGEGLSWLMRHANEYGFVLRYPQSEENGSESLFRFVGVENAMKIRSFGMSLDEYSVYLAQK